MTSKLSVSVRRAATIAVATCLALAACDSVIDFFAEGDDDPWYLEAGRYEGIWKFEGDARELGEFARGLERIEFQIAEPAPGSWRGKRPPEGAALSTSDPLTSALGMGSCVVGGAEYPFRLRSAPPDAGEAPRYLEAWLQFEEHPPFLTERAFGDGFAISLEAGKDPAKDWLYLWLGRNRDDSFWGMPYTRAE